MPLIRLINEYISSLERLLLTKTYDQVLRENSPKRKPLKKILRRIKSTPCAPRWCPPTTAGWRCPASESPASSLPRRPLTLFRTNPTRLRLSCLGGLRGVGEEDGARPGAVAARRAKAGGGAGRGGERCRGRRLPQGLRPQRPRQHTRQARVRPLRQEQD
eukprot:954632-Prorocentrum_minimum.AAC.1